MRHLLLLIPLLFCIGDVQSAEYQTANFTVTCTDAALAKQVGDAAEFYRDKHAKEWLGHSIPKWSYSCPIIVRQGNMGAGGATTFSFDRGQVFGWDMEVQGSPQRILDSVVPHEVLHTIFASHFRRSVPRWADEGACSYVEHISEKKMLKEVANSVAGTDKQIPIRRLLVLTEYPENVYTFYAQAFYICEHLIDLKGKPTFVKFIEAYFNSGDWDTAFAKTYGYSTQEEAYTAAWRANKEPQQLTATGIADAIKNPPESTPVTYDTWHIDVFTASNCSHCIKFKNNELKKLMEARNIKVQIFDLDEDHNWERAKQDNIHSVPAFVIYKNEKRKEVVRGFHTADQLIAKCKKEPETVQVAQGIGIGYFGPVGGGGNNNKANPHQDFSAAQLQQMQREIDARSQAVVDRNISEKLGQLDERIGIKFDEKLLKLESKLTDEQRATIGMTPEQKAELDRLRTEVANYKTATEKYQSEAAAKIAAQEKKDQELDKQVKEQKQQAEEIKSTIKDKVLAVVKDHVPEKAVGIATAIPGAITALAQSGPIGLALYLGARFIGLRRKDEEMSTQAQDKAK